MTSMQAWRKASKRISPKLSPSALSKITNDLEQSITGAPDSAFSIPQSTARGDAFVINNADGSSSNPHSGRDDDEQKGSKKNANPGAVVRLMGTSRRVFLINPSLTPIEIDGLAYRIRAMASNDGINSVVVANPLEDAERNGDMSENTTCLPSFVEEGEMSMKDDYFGGGGPYGKRQNNAIKAMLHERYGDGLGMPFVSSGYDARKIHEMGLHKDVEQLERQLMAPLISLSEAVRGSYDETINSSPSKVPCISLPHGLVTDAGYSLLLGSYVLATHSTAFRIVNPCRGLAFDPVGLTYLLPRMGWEFNQASANYSPACARILALGGYEANAADMVATGLATHYVGGPYKLKILERALADLNSFEYQTVHQSDKRMYGQKDAKPDINANFKNVAVANLIQHLSEYDAAGAQEYGASLDDDLDETGMYLKDKDPSLTMPEERIQIYGEHESELVNWAATFEKAFDEPTVEGIMENLREIAATKAEFEGKRGYEEDVMVAEQAESLVENMEQRSPLALCVMNQLLQRGIEEGETLESCMEREKASQMRLFTKEDGDYTRWAESGNGVGLVEMKHGNSSLIRKKEELYSGWAHSSVKEVTGDEIKEIIGV
ncbi:hypothetical protein ACHAXR_008715 [Thalassiosira sp. AJA248-18]